ncbi:MAG TPA: pilus assembly protein PilP [Gammaproteobacteria bacterium]|nr:pilus assembly protein PilP [Gammaproteobacteria bacterium]
MSDLEARVQELLARKASTSIEPLPEVKLPESYAYQSADANRRDPFESFKKEAATAQAAQKGAPQDAKTAELMKEIEGHNLEDLENFELDSLRMVGTLQDANELWGIILDKTGTVHRVKVGNYMGRNHGKILSISEDKIELREIVSTTTGSNGLEERSASIALSEPK